MTDSTVKGLLVLSIGVLLGWFGMIALIITNTEEIKSKREIVNPEWVTQEVDGQLVTTGTY